MCVCVYVCASVPKVRAVVYCTVSLFPEENEEVVRRCLEQSRTQQDLKPKLQHFGLEHDFPFD